MDLQRVKAIFIEAVEKLGPDRQAYLDRSCGGDRELRAEVEALLGAAEETDALAGGHDAALHSLDAARPDQADLTITEGPGAHVGRYKLLEQIGQGGCGVVFMAEQAEPVRRLVALKVIKLGMDTRQVIARFEAERQALAMMDHPNIARVLDVGSTESGRPYFVMELVRGTPLTEFCDENQLTTHERLNLFIQICRAVQHAHQKGIIHRDLKPSNVLVTMHDSTPVPKVIDFGIAKATQSRLTQLTLFTGFRQFMGTPQYTSPEQAQMSDLDVDTRADVYSLGVILYELLTGTTPLDPHTLRRAAFAEMQRIIREVEPPRPSTRLNTLGGKLATVAAQRKVEPQRLPRLVRGELDWIVMKCLEKDRTRRYETANGLAADVYRYLADEPVVARPASAAYRARKFVRRHKGQVAAGAALLAVLVLGIIGTTVGMLRARATQRDAVRQRDEIKGLLGEVRAAQRETEREARRARAANDFLQNMLRSARPDETRSGREVKVVDVLDQAASQLDRLADQPEIELDAHLTLGKTYQSLALFGPAAEQFGRALGLAQRVYGPESRSTLRIAIDLVSSTARNGQPEQIEHLAEYSVAAATRLFGEPDAVTRGLLHSLGVVRLRQRRDAEAEAIFRAVVAQSRAASPEDRALLPDGLQNLGLVLRMRGHSEAARQVIAEANELLRIRQEQDPVVRAIASTNLAATLVEGDDRGQADAAFRETLAYQRQWLGDDHPITLSTVAQYTVALQRMGRFEQAAPLRAELLNAYRGPLDAAPPAHGSLCQYAAIAAYLHDRDEHRRCCRELLERFAHSSEREINEWTVKACLLMPGGVDDLTVLDPLMERALAPGETPHRRFFEFAQGMLEYRADRFESALRWLQTSVEHGVRENIPIGLTTEFFLAMTAARLGRQEAARAALAAGLERMRPYLRDEAMYNLRTAPTDWVVCDLIRREARALILGEQPATRPASEPPNPPPPGR